MNDDLFLELSNYAGLLATVVLTLNYLLGMLLSTAYRRSIYWKKLPAKLQAVDINDLHNYTAYVALGLVFLHFVFVVFDKSSKFTISHLFLPLAAPHQPVAVMLGSLALLALLIIIVTTQKIIKKGLGFRLWKNIHLVSYAMALLFVVHGTLLDPHLKDRGVDYLDGEKLISEGCGILLIAASYIRYKYHLKKADI